jgi:prepilin peptidase CpaA
MENAALVVFPLLVMFAAFSDCLTFTIPNLVSLILVVAYLVISVFLGAAWQVVAIHLGCGVAVLGAGFVLFQLGVIGGGDAKLAAATALWLGVENLSGYIFVFSILGGVFALAILTYRCHDFGQGGMGSLLLRIADKASSRMPYGVPLGLAALLIYPHSQIWRGLAGV